jgi:hypothetical protein
MSKYNMRPLCKICGKKPCAVNYYKNKKVFYRKKCDSCSRGTEAGVPKWQRLGYRKKLVCEKCGFKSNYQEQFEVFHVDGNLENCKINNLKTICANCQRLLQDLGVKWRQGDLTPDF